MNTYLFILLSVPIKGLDVSHLDMSSLSISIEGLQIQFYKFRQSWVCLPTFSSISMSSISFLLFFLSLEKFLLVFFLFLVFNNHPTQIWKHKQRKRRIPIPPPLFIYLYTVYLSSICPLAQIDFRMKCLWTNQWYMMISRYTPYI